MTIDKITELYNLRSNFQIIGLTGRLGSGCSTIAGLLTKLNFEDCEFPIPQQDKFLNNEERKYRIAYNFLKENWKPFKLIRASDIILIFLLQNSYNEVETFLKDIYKTLDVNCFREKFVEAQKQVEGVFNNEHKISLTGYELLMESSSLSEFNTFLKEHLKIFTSSNIGSPFQYFGDNLRKTGNPLKSKGNKEAKNSYIIADVIKQLIKYHKSDNHYSDVKIIIDSIRNSFEARYFRERYAAFYLLAVNTKDKYREERLANDFSKGQIGSLDVEYINDVKAHQTFYKQDIKSCIQMSDIYLYNPDDDPKAGDTFKTLKTTLLRYLSLILQPGIVTPTPQERTMQVAYTAKYNSGCISRQVGAVVTDKDYSIKSIGWNNTPQGQTPCLLRNSEDLLNNTDNESFSEHEKSPEIKEYVKEGILNKNLENNLKGRNPCFCFKQVQNTIEGQKNQVHTRSLHAEENAMMQIAKYGGEGLMNGNLFTTASPCELCSKKAYQLGVKRIYYIDPYPGIATNQILKTGTHIPELVLFTGAVGKAYHAIFEPFMPYKDELELRIGVDFKEAKKTIISNNVGLIKKRKEELEKLIEDSQKEIVELSK
jgi:dCMP deaminase